MNNDYPFPDKCEKCIHNDVCYMVGECLNHIPEFECDCFEENRPRGEWEVIGRETFSPTVTYRCSVCKAKEVSCIPNDKPHYCENCGAYLIGG